MPKSASVQSDKLTDQTTLNTTIKVLEQHFDLSADGYICQTRDLYEVLVTAAARCSTIEATCKDLKDAPDSNTVRGYINAQLTPEDIAGLERNCKRALYKQWPHWLWSQPLNIAVDLHDECYYGEEADREANDASASWVCRGEKRNGTTYFYRCATLAVIRHQVQINLAVAFVHPDDDLVDVLKKLVKYVLSRGLRIGCLYADKQFCSIPVLRYLQTGTSFSAIIAAPKKGKDGGIKALCHGRKSYRTEIGRASCRERVYVLV